MENDLWDWLSVAIKSAINGIADDHIMWAGQDVEAKLTAPFVTLDFIGFAGEKPVENVEEFDTDIGANPDELVTQNLIYRAVGSVVVDVYGASAYFDCVLIKAALKEARVLDAMRKFKFGLLDVNDTKDLTAVVDTSWEGRANFTIRFHYTYVKEKTVESIGTVNVKTDVDEALQIIGDVDIDLTVNEP